MKWVAGSLVIIPAVIGYLVVREAVAAPASVGEGRLKPAIEAKVGRRPPVGRVEGLLDGPGGAQKNLVVDERRCAASTGAP